jgi:hypothetical protein
MSSMGFESNPLDVAEIDEEGWCLVGTSLNGGGVAPSTSSRHARDDAACHFPVRSGDEAEEDEGGDEDESEAEEDAKRHKELAVRSPQEEDPTRSPTLAPASLGGDMTKQKASGKKKGKKKKGKRRH